MSSKSNFKWLNSNGVESDRGFADQSIGRFEIEYREGHRKLIVDVETGWLSETKSCVIIMQKAFERWASCTNTSGETPTDHVTGEATHGRAGAGRSYSGLLG